MKFINKITYIISMLTLVSFIIFISIDKKSYIENIESDDYMIPSENTLLKKYEEISLKVVPYIIKAKVLIDDIEYVGEIIQDKQNGTTYNVKVNDSYYWVDKYYVNILGIDELTLYPLSDNEIEIYVNLSSFKSETPYFIWVDIYRNETYVLKNNNNYFYMYKRYDCTTGANVTPTKRGLFQISKKGDYFYSRDNTYICYYFMQYSGSYLLHSIPYSLKGEVLDDSMKKRVSKGCVRYLKDDCKEIYDLIPLKTSIWIN